MDVSWWRIVCGLYLQKQTERVVKAHFGLSVVAIAVVWALVVGVATTLGIKPIHLLWALYFLKVYPTEDLAANLFGTSRETYRKWVWKVIGLLYLHLDPSGKCLIVYIIPICDSLISRFTLKIAFKIILA